MAKQKKTVPQKMTVQSAKVAPMRCIRRLEQRAARFQESNSPLAGFADVFSASLAASALAALAYFVTALSTQSFGLALLAGGVMWVGLGYCALRFS
jgi:hypothetical protein